MTPDRPPASGEPHVHVWKREYAPNYRQASEADDWREECACGAFRSGTDRPPMVEPSAIGDFEIRMGPIGPRAPRASTGAEQMDGPTTRKPHDTPFSSWTVLTADDADGVRWYFHVPTAALDLPPVSGEPRTFGRLFGKVMQAHPDADARLVNDILRMVYDDQIARASTGAALDVERLIAAQCPWDSNPDGWARGLHFDKMYAFGSIHDQRCIEPMNELAAEYARLAEQEGEES